MMLRAAASAAPSYARLTSCVMSEFPYNRNDLHSSLIPYWKLGDHLYMDEELILYGQIFCGSYCSSPSHPRTSGEAGCVLAWHTLKHRQHSPSLRAMSGATTQSKIETHDVQRQPLQALRVHFCRLLHSYWEVLPTLGMSCGFLLWYGHHALHTTRCSAVTSRKWVSPFAYALIADQSSPAPPSRTSWSAGTSITK